MISRSVSDEDGVGHYLLRSVKVLDNYTNCSDRAQGRHSLPFVLKLCGSGKISILTLPSLTRSPRRKAFAGATSIRRSLHPNFPSYLQRCREHSSKTKPRFLRRQAEGNSAYFLLTFLDKQVERTDEWARRKYEIYCKCWYEQGHCISPEFVREARTRGIAWRLHRLRYITLAK
jgi:hypothetical protein